MLKETYYRPPTELDVFIFEKLVPADHYLRKVKALIDFERYCDTVASCYSPDEGRSADDPVLMVKLEFLQFQYNLSDRQVIAHAQVNVAFRYFLDLSIESTLPDPSLLSVFRRRVGPQKHEDLLQALVGQAREAGLVKDRLRLKDATHVIANIAIPSTIRLVAETRDRLLQAAQPLAPARVAEAQAHAAVLRQATADLSGEVRLLQRVNHLREIVTWAEALSADAAPPVQQTFTAALDLAHHVLADREAPEAGDKVVSVHDPEARLGKHGAYFDGYLLDLAMDADSELITAVNILPANGDETADAQVLITQEESAQGNDVQALSIDGIGFRGKRLREWQDPHGLNLAVFVPPTPLPKPTGYFTPQDFATEDAGERLRCPAEQATMRRYRTSNDSGWQYQFTRATCAACPLWARCMARLPQHNGRVVVKNDYQAEYAAARQKAQTPEYAKVRQQHPAIERKLAELVRVHRMRWARYRKQARVRIQALLTALVVNIKRMVHLSASARLQPASGGA